MLKEAEVTALMSGTPEFPAYHGIVDKPTMWNSFIMEYYERDFVTPSWTIGAYLIRHKWMGAELSNEQMMKVCVLLKSGRGLMLSMRQV